MAIPESHLHDRHVKHGMQSLIATVISEMESTAVSLSRKCARSRIIMIQSRDHVTGKETSRSTPQITRSLRIFLSPPTWVRTSRAGSGCLCDYPDNILRQWISIAATIRFDINRII